MALARILELGVGMNPSPVATVHHDRIKHSDFVDMEWDLNVLPWDLGKDWDHVMAFDVFEHLDLQPQQWLDQVWDILKPEGLLTMRLPAWDNPLSYRDPTHRRVFHEESFWYWDPYHTLHRDYGSYYFKESDRWWSVDSVSRESNDLKYVLHKRP